MASKRKGKVLRVARDLDLPLNAATQKIACLGRTGSGKTFASKRIVEQMLHAGVQVVILDGSGGWAGLRLGPRAFKIPVLGGLYGDIPLEPTAGALIADVIVDRRTSMVLDVSQMLDAERTRFATAFAQRFFQRKKADPGAVHLVLEECQDYVPENHQRGEERMLHEFQRLAKQGRPHGIGLTLISQRPQEVSKKALNQAECIFAFQMNGPQERRALQYWLTDKGFEGNLADVLPTLEVGHPYVWSPQWLKVSKIVEILPIESQDTSKTPEVGKRGASKKTLKTIDLKALNSAMAETIERAKAEDPAELRKQITGLKKELADRIKASEIHHAAAKSLVKHAAALGPFEIIVDRRHVETIIESSEHFEKGLEEFSKVLEMVRRRANGAASAGRRARQTGPSALSKRLAKAGPAPKEPVPDHGTTREVVRSSPPKATKPISNGSNGHSALGGGLRRMMIALAQRPGLTNRQIGVRAGLSSKSGTFSTYLGRARSMGWIVDDGDRRSLTPAGVEALGAWEPLPRGAELLDYWVKELGGGAARMLVSLAAAYPGTLTNEQLGHAAGINHKSGTFSTYLGKLRSLELVVGRGDLQASEELSG